MKALGVASFKKTPICPSEMILVSYNSRTLSPEIMSLVRFHLASCDFCSAELRLLLHYSLPQQEETQAPDIPQDLRILADSLFCQVRRDTVEDDEPDLILH